MDQSTDVISQLKILSLEDSPNDAELIYEHLCENFGMDIHMDKVMTEEEYISAISSKKYDVILADFKLPGFDGFAALEHAKRICPLTPYICVTGFIGEESAVDLLKNGATDYVSKDKLGRLVYSIERAIKEAKDRADLQQIQASLIESEERFRATFEQAAVGIMHVTTDGIIVRVNRKFCSIVGYSQEELLKMSFMDITHTEDLENDMDNLARLLKGDISTYSIEKRYTKKDGNFVWANLTVSAIYQFSGELAYIMGIVEDITERKMAEIELAFQNDKISYLSYHDFLTDLYNRAFFEEEKIRLDTQRQLPISIIMGDINGLKLINDGFGHAKGDEVIIEIAQILKSCGREEDIIARIGGDEFGIILPRTDSASAQLMCNRIYDECKTYELYGDRVYPSISLGHATKMMETESLDDVLIFADESMTRQKLLDSRSAHSSIIASIKAIMFEKSQETEEHAERLIKLSRSIGITMSLSDDQLNELELLSTLHDIGKMGISASILSKREKLSNEEWSEIKKHPEIGFRIAQATSELVPIAQYVLCHHERWDGKGYPQGLKGEDIPLLSRILSIVDSFDAMTNDRAYREAMSKEEAIEEIKRCAGTQFDPNIAKIFLNIVL
ncbi:MAG: HD domain-containing phosphohydrolase [Eubacteriales bacterium]